MRIGVTGSRSGMTADQTRIFGALFNKAVWDKDDPPTELHYGDCVGVDSEIADVVILHDMGEILHCHPATMSEEWDEKWCARTYQTNPGLGIVVYPAKNPLERNTDIVGSCDVLWAFPADMNMKGGTWDTINKAFDSDVPVRIVAPVVNRFHRGE